MFVVLIRRTCHGVHENISIPIKLQALRMSGRCFLLMIWSFSPASKSAELTLSSDLAQEREAILKNLASGTVSQVNLFRLQMIYTA